MSSTPRAKTPEKRTIEVNGIQILASLCYKCGARVFPESHLEAHLKRHDLNAEIYLVGYKRVSIKTAKAARAAKDWEKGWR